MRPDSAGRIVILHEDDDIVAVDKPEGLPAMAPEGSRSRNLYDIGHGTYPEDESEGASRHRPTGWTGDTSGVMVFAKNARAKKRLMEKLGRTRQRARIHGARVGSHGRGRGEYSIPGWQRAREGRYTRRLPETRGSLRGHHAAGGRSRRGRTRRSSISGSKTGAQAPDQGTTGRGGTSGRGRSAVRRQDRSARSARAARSSSGPRTSLHGRSPPDSRARRQPASGRRSRESGPSMGMPRKASGPIGGRILATAGRAEPEPLANHSPRRRRVQEAGRAWGERAGFQVHTIEERRSRSPERWRNLSSCGRPFRAPRQIWSGRSMESRLEGESELASACP